MDHDILIESDLCNMPHLRELFSHIHVGLTLYSYCLCYLDVITIILHYQHYNNGLYPSRTLHRPLSPTPSDTCAGAAESIWTSRCTERRTLTKCTGDSHTYTNSRYTHICALQQKPNTTIQSELMHTQIPLNCWCRI